MSNWRTFLEKWRRETAAYEIMEITVMTSHNWLLLTFLDINNSKMYEKVFRVVLNKIGTFCWVVEQTQNYRFLPFFFRYFIRMQCYRRRKYDHIRHQRLKINTKRCFVFSFTQILILTVIFAIFVGHIGLKNLTENADLQSQTMTWAEEHDMSIWRNLSWISRRESAAKEIMKKSRYDVIQSKFSKNEKSVLSNFR